MVYEMDSRSLAAFLDDTVSVFIPSKECEHTEGERRNGDSCYPVKFGYISVKEDIEVRRRVFLRPDGSISVKSYIPAFGFKVHTMEMHPAYSLGMMLAFAYEASASEKDTEIAGSPMRPKDFEKALEKADRDVMKALAEKVNLFVPEKENSWKMLFSRPVVPKFDAVHSIR